MKIDNEEFDETTSLAYLEDLYKNLDYVNVRLEVSDSKITVKFYNEYPLEPIVLTDFEDKDKIVDIFKENSTILMGTFI